MYSKYRARFYTFELEDNFFQTKISKLGEKVFSSVPKWVGYLLFILYWVMHFAIATGFAYLFDRSAPFALSMFMFYALISLYFISKMRFESASKELLLEFYDDCSTELKVYEELLACREIHFLRQTQPGHASPIVPNKFLKEKLGNDLAEFNMRRFMRLHTNQTGRELNDFVKELKEFD